MSVVRRLGDDVVHPAELLRIEIIIPTELLAADVAGQSRIHWRRDAERIVICRRHKLVVHGQEAAVRGAEIADIEPYIRAQLALDGDRALPVVVLLVEAAECIRRPVCAAGCDLTEGQIAPLPTLTIR